MPDPRWLDHEYHDDEYDSEEDEDDHFLNFVCGMMKDGQCTLAGSEECDWEYPRRR